MVFAQPNDWITTKRTKQIGKRTTFTSGPAAMLQSVAPGRGGGSTYANPPNGQSTILVALPPTFWQASTWPYSWNSTIRKSARYSSTFHVIDEYLPARVLISNTATRNQDQCRNTSTPAKRNSLIDPWRVVGIAESYNTIPGRLLVGSTRHDSQRRSLHRRQHGLCGRCAPISELAEPPLVWDNH